MASLAAQLYVSSLSRRKDNYVPKATYGHQKSV
eukprot:CAMPEP_0172736496 /NCGR_PEP_ID=MMETSP1074-20121228/115219_1 /TAXON_ID=2916 /ORGANISM="Ceratium fusus, Strain PA161109" /LENGTH=32 /DNA_ID= /DNA_START= /DNA_END= /DNA_ORIENTATION=